MKIRVFTLQYSTTLGGFDDTEVCDFIRDKRVESVTDHAFVQGGVPHLCLVVLYHLTDSGSIVPTGKVRAKTDETWRKMLTPETTPLFDSLREWRSERAKEEGVPSYFLFTNKQLVDIVLKRPDSLNQLGQIEGVGKAKLERHGKVLLALLDFSKAW